MKDAGVLNCFPYTGGFDVASLASGGPPMSLNVDSSGPARSLHRAIRGRNALRRAQSNW